MNASEKKKIQAMRLIRREFWIDNLEWKAGLEILKSEYKMQHEDAINFLGDSTNLDPQARLQVSLNAIPFGVSLTHPSILL